jgi:hypothetical protein
MLIFKYVSPDAVSKVFEQTDKLLIRFGLPRDYNDPYELFLQPSPPIEAEEVRAFYLFFLGELAQAPVACFSKRPESLVMWAHYGREGAGMCLGFDEDRLVNEFPLAYVADISYSDGPATVAAGLVEFAYETAKRRHTLALIETAQRAAYFTKRSDWAYESERRIVVPPNAVEEHTGVLVGKVGPEALRYIVVGPAMGPDLRELCESRAKRWHVPVIRLRVGTRTFAPFFSGDKMSAGVWSGSGFQEIVEVCDKCGEPSDHLESGECSWCVITEDAQRAAGNRSLLAATLALGIDKGLPFAFQGLMPRGQLVRKPSGETPKK